jgi:pimeloyl-ACP methyl ester carboxylesterase
MAVFVLVHGAWHGAWCWERVLPLLEQRGHRVLAPDLPGMGRDPTPLAAITLDGWARFVADLVGRQAEPVILVGHSRGGVVTSQAADRVPDRVAILVYLAGFMVPSGGSLWSTMQLVPRDRARPSGSGDVRGLAPQAVSDTFYNTTGADWVSRAAAPVGPEPMATWVTSLALSEGRFG